MVKGKLLKFVLFIVTKLLVVICAPNYCGKKLCRGRNHVVCNNNLDFSKTCGFDTKFIPITDKIRQRILNDHNVKRNQIAGGNLTGYEPAKRMGTMQWSEELAKIAEFHAKTCSIAHDECRNTKDFPFAGQNTAVAYWYGLKRTVEQNLDQHMQFWWDELFDCSKSIINSFQTLPSKAIGHFTQMAQERSTHVGCAIVTTKRSKYHYHYTTCNYDFINFISRAVYRKGKTASLCKTGTNPDYGNLCSINEVYNAKSGNY